MTLPDNDRAEMKLLAIEAAKEIIRDVMASHLAGCPVKQDLNTKIAYGMGISTGIALIAMIVAVVMYFV